MIMLTVFAMAASLVAQGAFETAYRSGVAAYRAGDLERAIAFFESAVEADPEHVEARFNLALALSDAKQADRALEILTPLEGEMPDRSLYLFTLGGIYAELGRLEEAESALREATTLRPEAARAPNQLGEVLVSAGKRREAIAAFAEASRRQPSWVQPVKRLGELQLATGDPGAAVATLERAAALAPRAPLVHLSLGDAYAASGRFDEAAAAYRTTLETRSDMAQVWARLGNAQSSAGNVEEAIGAHQKAVALDGSDTRLRLALALALMSAERNDDAAAELEKVVAMAPDTGSAWYYLGVLDAEAHPERAIERLGRASAALRRASSEIWIPAGRGGEEYPIAIAARVRLAELLSDTTELDRARALLEEVLGEEPDHASSLYALGMLQRKLGDREQAQETLSRFRIVNEAREHDQLALQALESGDASEAVAELERALAVFPDDHAAHWIYARLAVINQDDPEAEKHLALAVDARPRFEKAYEQWIVLLCRGDRIDDARAVIQRARAAGVSPAPACVSE